MSRVFARQQLGTDAERRQRERPYNGLRGRYAGQSGTTLRKTTKAGGHLS